MLINGPWGSGKTYFIKDLLKRHFRDSSGYVYVSLYGLANTDELDSALFEAIYPALGWKITKVGTKTAKAAAKFFNVDSELRLRDILSKSNASLYVFDDLERSEMPINKVLGYINQFVEHDECKVVILANENEIADLNAYLQRREKLVGKTFKFQPTIESALPHFLNLVDNKNTKLFLQKKSEKIRNLYDRSELSNLRILQQTIWDFERLFRELSTTQIKSDVAIDELLRLFFALSFEVKAGRLHSSNIERRPDAVAAVVRKANKSNATSWDQATERYSNIDLHSSILSDKLLSELLVKGFVDGEGLRTYLDSCESFSAPDEEPAWRTVWHGIERTDEAFNKACNLMETQFSERMLTVTGEILHVFGLRLWLTDIGAIQPSRSQILSECKAYVDDIAAQGKIEPLPISSSREEFHFSGYAGLGIHSTETTEYKELFDYLKDMRERAREKSYPAKARELLLNMQNDIDLFFKHIDPTSDNDGTFSRAPVLASIDPTDFTEALLRLHPDTQRRIFEALARRYEVNRIERELSAERSWLENLRDHLIQRSHTMSPIQAFRIKKNVEWSISPTLSADAEQ